MLLVRSKFGDKRTPWRQIVNFSRLDIFYNNSMIISMNKRLTISIPDYLYNSVTSQFKRGEVSKFATKAFQTCMLDEKLKKAADPVKSFLKLRKDLPKLSWKKIKSNIERGRM